MPRIRTIKPETWSDEKLGKLKRECRLLFIGLWNFSDDYGTVRSNPIWIKSQVFPYDEDLRIDVVTKWLAALVDARMLEPFEYNGEGFYNIRSFLSHQKVEKPSRPIVPIEEKRKLLGGSPNSRGVFVEYSAPEVVSSNRIEEGGGAPAPKPSVDWPGLTEQQAWTANELTRLTGNRLPAEQIRSEAVRLIEKKPSPPYSYVTTWANNLLQNLTIAPPAGQPAPAGKSVKTGIKNL